MPILILFAIFGAILGFAIGYYLTTLVAVLFTMLSCLAYVYVKNTERRLDEDLVLFTFAGGVVANVIMWITSLVFVGANWEWVKVLVSQYIFQH